MHPLVWLIFGALRHHMRCYSRCLDATGSQWILASSPLCLLIAAARRPLFVLAHLASLCTGNLLLCLCGTPLRYPLFFQFSGFLASHASKILLHLAWCCLLWPAISLPSALAGAAVNSCSQQRPLPPLCQFIVPQAKIGPASLTNLGHLGHILVGPVRRARSPSTLSCSLSWLCNSTSLPRLMKFSLLEGCFGHSLH